MKNKILYLGSLLLSSSIFRKTEELPLILINHNRFYILMRQKIQLMIPITSQGYMGIVTINPGKRLEINSTIQGAIKIANSTQKQNAFLMSDENSVVNGIKKKVLSQLY